MIDRKWSEEFSHIGIILAVIAGLYASSLYSYILFHSLIEIATIAVAFTLFVITWNSRRYLGNGYLRLLGIGYAFIALIDLLHTLAYKGMTVFPGYGANLPTQLWIAARYLQAATLFAAPLVIGRKLNDHAVFGGYAAVTAGLAALVYSGVFPDCYVDGKGLTPFKIGSEYVITAILLVALCLFFGKRKYFDTRIFIIVASSIVCTALSELSFTAYVSVYGFANLLGHFFKLTAFYLIYQAILVTGIREPFELIFRDLKRAEAALRKSQDILEDKVSERTAELRASEDRFRRLFEDNKTIQILVDPAEGRIVDANHAAARYYGHDRDRLRTMTVFEINAADSAVVRRNMVAIREGVMDFFTTRHRLASGEVRDVEVWSGPIDFSGCPLLYSTIHDITARRQAESARSRLAAIVESSGDAIVGKSVDGTVISWNRSAEILYGYDAAEIIGRPVDTLAPPDRRGEAARLIARILGGEPVANYETVRRRKDGSLVEVSLTLSPIRDEQGVVTGISTIARDITVRKQTETELRHYRENLEALVADRTAALTESNHLLAIAKERAEAANLAKTMFLANMSHEIRTPMNAILGFAQILQRRTNLPAEDRESVEVIHRAGRNLLALINDILEMSKIEAGRTEFLSGPCDLHALLEDLRAMFKVAADAKGLCWELVTAPDLPRWIATDESKLRQILINLLGNAVKFTDAGGVVLRATVIAADAAGWLLVIEVSDSGPGIAPEDQEHLFEAFQQAPAGATRGGAGLGLALSRRFARLMGGDITMTSASGRGSVFRLEAPVTAETPAKTPAVPPRHRALRVRAGAGERRILITDDKADNRLFLRCLLEPLGFGLREAENGRDALAVAGEWRPHLILMDIVMPVMGGHEAIRRIRAAPGGRDVRIIALSASAFDEDRDAVLASGADDFVRKPVSADALLEAIRVLTGIEYEYADDTGGRPDTEIAEVPRPEMASRLPPAILEEMRLAVYQSDDRGLASLIDGLPPDLDDIAGALRHALSQFDWDTLEGVVGLPPRDART